MASLFATIDDLKNIVGGSVNVSVNTAKSLAPFFDIAHERHMEAWLGTTLYDDLVTTYDDANGSLDPDQTALMPYYRKALAWLTLYEYLPHAAIQLSEAGLHRLETDERKTAYKYQEKRILENCLTNGYEAMEKLIKFLETNKATYTDWEDAPGYEKHHGVLLETAANFRIVHNKRLTRHVYEILRGTVEDVENFVIVPLLGEDQYDALLTARKTDTWTTEAKEKKLIYLCNRITAHFALAEGIRLNWVQFEGDRVTQREYQEDQGVPKEGVAGRMETGVRISAHDDTGNRYIQKVRDYLATNIDDAAFADYKAYKEALEAAAEAEEEARLAAQDACTPCDSSERLDHGTAFGFGQPCTTTRKGAVRL